MADMSCEQNRFLSFLKLQGRSVLSNGVFYDQVTFIQGGAGTRISFLLKNMYNYVTSKLGAGSVQILCTTGVGSRNDLENVYHQLEKVCIHFKSYMKKLNSCLLMSIL